MEWKNGNVNHLYVDRLLNEMNKSQHYLLEEINKLQQENTNLNIINACTDITGFGLLGHLYEMVKYTNNEQLKANVEPIKMIINLDSIPIYDGAINLLEQGFESTLAPSNKVFLNSINGNSRHSIELIHDQFLVGSLAYNMRLKILLES